MYYKNEQGEVYYENPEQPIQAFDSEEWIIERERLIVGLQNQIDDIQIQIDNNPQLIEILDSYPGEVKSLIEQHNSEIPSVEDLETQKQIKIDLKIHIEEL